MHLNHEAQGAQMALMRITGYRFGAVTVDGAAHTADVLVRGETCTPWRRKRGHAVAIEDLEAVLDPPPEILVLGTGAFGLMRVPAAVRAAIEDRGVEVVAKRTAKAVETFNALSDAGRNVAIGMHLTC